MIQKKLDYIIKLTYDKAYKGYVADVVNLYGCMSQGKTKKEALENAEKAIKAYMEAININKDKNAEFTRRSVDTPIPVLNA
ncbi:type II toxin-antitoxin system HicB family antitoxin [Candidatus Microgenomates bacterium]|nr:type II toxin-antitoxin system HicB family antitoxin [Candidatus Microgenomates bacterium]